MLFALTVGLCAWTLVSCAEVGRNKRELNKDELIDMYVQQELLLKKHSKAVDEKLNSMDQKLTQLASLMSKSGTGVNEKLTDVSYRLRIIEATMQTKAASSCARWYAVGRRTAGPMRVDPDGEGPLDSFIAHCDLLHVNINEAIPTVITHDVPARREINSSCRSAQCFTQDVNYVATKEQIIALMRASARCSQWIQYECRGSLFHHHGKRFAAWYSRDGEEMTYWGGAHPGATDKCACGMTNSCDDPSKSCNCDVNDKQWRADDGELKDKNTLPVSAMKFGDLDGALESGIFTLGPLICWSYTIDNILI